MIFIFSILFLIFFISWEGYLILSFFIIFFIMKSFYGNLKIYFMEMTMMNNTLLLLLILISLLMLLSSLKYKIFSQSWNSFFLVILLMLLILFLCFSVSNFLMFYINFELVVVPTYLMILGWGYSPERIQAGLYLFLFTLMASLPLMFFLFFLVLENKSLNFNSLMIFKKMNSSYMSLWWIFISLVFMVKMPIFLVHIWLPKAHVEAPVAGSMILAGILLKLGGYGFLKSFQVKFENFLNYYLYLFSLSLIGTFSVSLICLRQMDLKCLIAYSSVAHMGLVMMALLSLSSIGSTGALIMMIAHGLTSSSLFYSLNLIYERKKSRSILILKSMKIFSSVFTFWWFFMCCCNMSCPPSLNFFSEILMIFSILSLNNQLIFFMVLILLLSGIYSIYLYICMNHGKNMMNKVFQDLMLIENFNMFIHNIYVLIAFSFMFVF